MGSLWAFRRKRYPDGRIRSYKARWCPRGDHQKEGVDFFETYAPVVAWSTVRLLLIMAVSLGLETRQVDYTLAFVHGDLKETVYCEMPPGYVQPGKVFKLNKSVYGLRQSATNWFKKLSKGLRKLGFRPSKYEPCLFYTGKVICLTYVDDCLFFARKREDIEAVVNSLDRKQGGDFDLGYEDSDVVGYLGIKMTKREDGSLELLQPGLVERVLKTLGLEKSAGKPTPSNMGVLVPDVDGEPPSEPWGYSSVVGMLMYLAANSRPDIAFSVHQCARYAHHPRRSHEEAIKRIGRYLNGTKERGMIIKPSGTLRLDCYADADFAGQYGYLAKEDPASVRSRTGYVLTLGGIPILWISKLQTEIALSTLEAEYIALSQAMRDLLPMRKLLTEITKVLCVERDATITVSTVWEDNNGAIALAKKEAPLMTPRTKHIAIKYHWFRSKLQPGQIELQKIDTKVQLADIFTKSLPRLELEEKRKLLIGW